MKVVTTENMVFDLPMTETKLPPPITPRTLFHVGVSGGKDSAAALLWMVHKSGIPKEQIVATIDDVVRWSMTGDRAEGSYLDTPEKEQSCKIGFCE